MKKLNINITKAQLKSFTVQIEEGEPRVDATIELLTEGGMVVTSFSASTRKYYGDKQFELPFTAAEPILKLITILEQSVVKVCRDHQKGLAAPKEEVEEEEDLITKAINEAVVDLDEIDDKPIDLSEIPF